jgi:cysteine desulfurase
MLGEGRNSSVYMDYQASTPADPRVVEAMAAYWADQCGNPHATDHSVGWAADKAVEAARAQIATLIRAEPEEIVFTSGATEANNLAVLGIARAAAPERRKIVVSAIEHKCVLGAANAAGSEGFEVVVVPVDRGGMVDPNDVARVVDNRTALVSVMAVNNEIGTIQPLRAIAALCHAHGVAFHSDAAQALSVLPLDVADIGVDLMSLSAHKAYGPKGIGALYVRHGITPRPRPIMHGGGQEGGLRPGTLPTPLCVGFGEACRILSAERDDETPRIVRLRDRLVTGLRALMPNAMVNGAGAVRHSGNLNMMFPGIEASLLLQRLQPNVAASTGSACTSGQPEPSHVLRAIGLTSREAEYCVRFSVGRFTREKDIDEVVSFLREALAGIAVRR